MFGGPQGKFYPNLNSALIDQADVSGEAYPPTYDFNGIARNGNSSEIGAYEWDGAINPGWPVQEGFKTGACSHNGLLRIVMRTIVGNLNK